MNDITIFFDLEELVCKHVLNKYGQTAWSFFDERLLETMYWVRVKLNKPMYGNNYQIGGVHDERGLRCNICDLVKEKSLHNIVYQSAHVRAQAFDFDVQGMVAEEVRQWLVKNAGRLPYPIRLESGVSWVHLDVANNTNQKVVLFNQP